MMLGIAEQVGAVRLRLAAAACKFRPALPRHSGKSTFGAVPQLLTRCKPLAQTCSRDEAAAHRQQLIATWREEGQTDEVRC